MNIAVN